MDRYRRRLRLRPRRDSGLPNKHGAAVTKTLSHRDGKKRLLIRKRYETLHEVPEETETDKSPVIQKHQEVAFSAVGESKSRPARPGASETWRNKRHPPPAATPRNHRSNFGVNPIPRVLKSPVMHGEEHGYVCEGVASPSVEPDTSFSCSDDDDDEDEDPTLSSSFSSPEIFRTCSDAQPHLHNKNSTLLDVSHARSIHMHLSPDLSTIMDASMIPPDKNSEDICSREPEPVHKTQADSSVVGQALEKNSAPKFFKRRSIVFKKKVWFKSPIISETFKVKDAANPAAATAVGVPDNDSSQTSSPPEKLRFDADESSSGGKDETPRLKVTLQRPVKSGAAERVKFFDFVDIKGKDEFFRKMRERHARLAATAFYPFTSTHEHGLVSGCQL